MVTGSFKQHDGMLEEQELQTQWMLPRGLENDVPMNKKKQKTTVQNQLFLGRAPKASR